MLNPKLLEKRILRKHVSAFIDGIVHEKLKQSAKNAKRTISEELSLRLEESLSRYSSFPDKK
ncbi:TraY domain-containing protein [Yersinia enterocolitica]|nr:TraY domain-containing protein [Yersinia enterocolitica]